MAGRMRAGRRCITRGRNCHVNQSSINWIVIRSGSRRPFRPPAFTLRGRVYIRVGPRKDGASELDRLPGANDCADRFKLAIDPIWLDVMLAVHIHTSFMHPPFGFALVFQKSVALKEVKTSGIYEWRVALRRHPGFDGRHRIDVDPDAHYRRAVMV